MLRGGAVGRRTDEGRMDREVVKVNEVLLDGKGEGDGVEKSLLC